MDLRLPECSKWSVWSGVEIEAEGEDLGKKTLFVRSNWEPWSTQSDRDILMYHDVVWFCADHKCSLKTIEWAVENANLVVLEVDINNYNKYPQIMKEVCRLYFVVPPELKQNDYIKCGNNYAQRVIRLDNIQGTSVSQEQYADDIRLK